MTYVSTAGLPAGTPRWTPYQAVRYALGEVGAPDMNYSGRCDQFCAWCYGYAGSGYYSAIAHWRAIPSTFKHRDWSTPPSGALCFWNIGTYGHASLAVGPNLVASNDVKRIGKIDVVSIDYITSLWGAQYLGWTQPYLAASWGENPNTPPTPEPPPPPTPVPALPEGNDMFMVKAPDGYAYMVEGDHVFQLDGFTANSISVPFRGSVPYIQASNVVWQNLCATKTVHYLK